MDVSLAVLQEQSGAVKTYIDEHYVTTHYNYQRVQFRTEHADESRASAATSFLRGGAESDVNMLAEKLDGSFSAPLLKLIDDKGRTDAEAYKRANIDRKLFSKIGNADDHSRKSNADAPGLFLSETKTLRSCAGYALASSSTFDVIISYFISSGKCDIFESNNILFE